MHRLGCVFHRALRCSSSFCPPAGIWCDGIILGHVWYLWSHKRGRNRLVANCRYTYHYVCTCTCRATFTYSWLLVMYNVQKCNKPRLLSVGGLAEVWVSGITVLAYRNDHLITPQNMLYSMFIIQLGFTCVHPCTCRICTVVHCVCTMYMYMYVHVGGENLLLHMHAVHQSHLLGCQWKCPTWVTVLIQCILLCTCTHVGKTEEETLEELSSRATSRMTSGTSRRSRAPTSMGMATIEEGGSAMPSIIPGMYMYTC